MNVELTIYRTLIHAVSVESTAYTIMASKKYFEMKDHNQYIKCYPKVEYF